MADRAAAAWSLAETDPSFMHAGQVTVPFGWRNAQVWQIFLPQRTHITVAGTPG
jgi:hypothetical protein